MARARRGRARPGSAGALAALALLAAGCAHAGPGGAAAGPAAAPRGVEALALAEGDAAFAGRLDPARLDAALDAYRRAAAAAPGDAAPELRLARAWAFRALGAPSDAARRAAASASARAAERALRASSPRFAAAVDAGRPAAEAAALVDAPGAEPLYWLARGEMEVAQATGPVAVLALVGELRPLLERAAALDERVDAGGPLRLLGAWEAMLPVPAGGGVGAARARFERAAALFPDEPWRRVLEASTLRVLLQDAAGFDRLLGEVLAARAGDPARAPELELARRRARALLDKRAALF